MSLFKDQVAADIAATFINFDEFATEHDIDGENLTIVLDSNLNTGNKFKGVTEDGVYLNHITFFVAENVLGYRPVENDHMTFDGYPCTVASCDEDFGLLEITLEVNRS